MGRLLRALVALPFVVCAFDANAAETAHRLEWDPSFRRFHPIEYVATPIFGGIAVVRLLTTHAPEKPNWVGPILFDAPARNALRVRDASTLRGVRIASDVVTLLPVLNVLIVDSLVLPAIDGTLDLAWQMTAMNAEAFALSGLVVGALFDIVARARPSYEECQSGRSDDPLCNSGKFANFPSGHTATAFTAAGLSCAHHMNLPLWGSRGADVAACLGSLTLATGAGILRIMGDRHYVSDVIAGAGIGFLFGFGLPSLLHYRARPISEIYRSPTVKVALGLGTATTPFGANAFGLF